MMPDSPRCSLTWSVAWVYDEVHVEVQGIEGLVAFCEKVDLEVDGQP